jgi:hypothetical protein
MFPKLTAPPATIIDQGAVRLGSGSISTGFPARKATKLVKPLAAAVLALGLFGCTQAIQDIGTVATAVNGVCGDVAAAEASIAGFPLVVNSPVVENIEAYAASACAGAVGTAGIIQTASTDPTTLSWIAGLATDLKLLLPASSNRRHLPRPV